VRSLVGGDYDSLLRQSRNRHDRRNEEIKNECGWNLYTYLELLYCFLISSDSSMIASYSDCNAFKRAGMEVWLAGRGGRVEGSFHKPIAPRDCNKTKSTHSL
jgi:hypothetical protein